MQKLSLAHPVLSVHRIVIISVGILSVLLLASCGGGGSTNPNATVQSVDDGTKTIQAVSGSTAVPGTWTGRAPKMEVINGITVPPEPAPAINNATLAGVDVNNNGVRDDVERQIAKSSKSQKTFVDTMAVAIEYSVLLKNKSMTTRLEALQFYGKLLCSAKDNYIAGQDANFIQNSIYNTPARKATFDAVNTLIDGGYAGSEIPNCQ